MKLLVVDASVPVVPQRFKRYYDFMNSIADSNVASQWTQDSVVVALDTRSHGLVKNSRYAVEDSRSRSLTFVRDHIISRELFSHQSVNLAEIHSAEIWQGYVHGLIKKIDMLTVAFDENKPTEVLNGCAGPIGSIVEEICRMKKVPCSHTASRKSRFAFSAVNTFLPIGMKLLSGGKTASVSTDRSDMRPTLLFPMQLHSPRYIEVFLTLQKALQSQYRLLVIGMDLVGSEVFAREGIEFCTLSSYGKFPQSFSSQHTQFKKEIILYKDVNLQPHLQQLFTYLFTQQFPVTAERISQMKTAIEKERPVAVLISEYTNPFNRMVASVVAQTRIPSFTLQHGYMQNNPLYAPMMTDYYVVWGTATKDLLASAGCDASKIIVTGNPQYDEVSIDRISENVVFLTQPLACSAEVARMVLTATRGRKVVIKVHPHEDGALYEKIAAEIGGNVVIEKEASLAFVLSRASIVIGLYSTALLEAMVYGTPVISIVRDDLPVFSGVTDGVVVGVRTVDELRQAVNHGEKQDDEKIAAYVETTLGVGKEKAIPRIVKVIGEGINRTTLQ